MLARDHLLKCFTEEVMKMFLLLNEFVVKINNYVDTLVARVNTLASSKDQHNYNYVAT